MNQLTLKKETQIIFKNKVGLESNYSQQHNMIYDFLKNINN